MGYRFSFVECPTFVARELSMISWRLASTRLQNTAAAAGDSAHGTCQEILKTLLQRQSVSTGSYVTYVIPKARQNKASHDAAHDAVKKAHAVGKHKIFCIVRGSATLGEREKKIRFVSLVSHKTQPLRKAKYERGGLLQMKTNRKILQD